MLVAPAGCDSEDVFFVIEVPTLEDTDGCPDFPITLSRFHLELADSMEGDPIACFQGSCAGSGSEDCVAGRETPPVPPGRSIHVRLGLFHEGMIRACAEGGSPSISEGERIELEMSCPGATESCSIEYPMMGDCAPLGMR